MNIELTTICPLRCAQCYCKPAKDKNIDKDKAIYWLKQAGEMGVKSVHLSGGETLCYPYIYELVSASVKYCGNANVALSGYNFTEEVYDKLIESGITGIYISLNGSTEEVNSLTRDGFALSLSALSLLKEKKFPETFINWVMHSNNVSDFPNVFRLAESFNVKNLVIMTAKPNSRLELNTAPSVDQVKALAKLIKHYYSPVQIMVEACYSPMLALVFDDGRGGNTNTGINKGCGAGLTSFNVNVDGKLSPCRHLDYFEDYESLDEYWQHSTILRMLRVLEYARLQPCNTCKYNIYCRHCIAINSKLNNSLHIGNEFCELHKTT